MLLMMLMAEGRKWPEISVGGKIVEERENRMMIIIRIIRTCLSTTKLYVGTFLNT